MERTGQQGSHLKIQYFLLLSGLVLGIALPRAYATGDNNSARIAQLESRVGALTSRVQALENKTTFVRRIGDRMEINAPNLHLANTALVLSGPRGSLTVQDANVQFGKTPTSSLGRTSKWSVTSSCVPTLSSATPLGTRSASAVLRHSLAMSTCRIS